MRNWVRLMTGFFALIFCSGASGTTVKDPTNCSSRPCTYTHTCAGAACTAGEVTDFLANEDDAELGDTIICEAGKRYPVTGTWEILGHSGSGVLTIQSALVARLADALITPEQEAALCTFETTGATSIIVFPAHDSNRAQNVTLDGLRFTLADASTLTHQEGLVRVGGGPAATYTVDAGADTFTGGISDWVSDDTEMACNATDDLSAHVNYFVVGSNGSTFQVSLTEGGSAIDLTVNAFCRAMWLSAWQPTGITLNRILVTMDQPQSFLGNKRLGRGLLLDADVTITNSWIDDVANNVDSQGILVASGTITATNNYLGGATENVMYGGTPRSIYTPSGGGFWEGNIFAKNPRQRQELGWEANTWYEIGAMRKSVDLATATMIAQNSGTSGGSEPTWPATDGSVVDNEITWVRRAFTPSFKNNFETKDSADLVFVRNGLYFNWNGAQSEATKFASSSISSNAQETPPFRSGIVNTSGATVTWVSGDKLPWQYGIAGALWDDIVIDSVTLEIDEATSLWTTTGGSDTSLELTSTPTCDPCSSVAFSYGDTSDNHQLAQVSNILFAYNRMRHVNAVMWSTARSHAQRGSLGPAQNMHIVGNLVNDIGGIWNPGATNILNTTPFEGMKVLHNTFLHEVSPDTARSMFAAGGWADDGEFLNNITTGWFAGDATAFGQAAFQKYYNANATLTTAQMDKNAFLGGALTTLTVGTRWNECPSDSACASPDYDTIFEDQTNDEYRVIAAHAGYQAGTDGLSIGANPDLVPDISVRVEVGDTNAIIRIEASAGVRSLPCVARVSTDRDLRTLLTDQDVTQGASYAGAYADNQDGSPAGAERVIPLGIRTPLTASTVYYYGVYCGGAQLDVPWHDLTYSFTTLAALTGTGEISVTGTPTATGTADRVLRWGTSYDRATDTIQSPTLGTEAACTTAAGCTVEFTTNRGDLVYYRVLDRDSGDSVLESGPVRVAVVL